MFELMIEDSFAAAHRLLNYEGLCENQHGHNWKVQIYYQDTNLDKAGMLIDFKLLKNALNTVLNKLDHKDLNNLNTFIVQSPSSEAIAKYIYIEMKLIYKEITKVSVWETENSCATYWE